MGLQLKLFSIYILALALSGCIVAIFLQEIKVIREIESEKDAMRRQYSVMEDVRSRVIELYAIGEYVLGWDENDYAMYRTKRLTADSVLVSVRHFCIGSSVYGKIDSLRSLLAEKERHLRTIMQTVRRQDAAERTFNSDFAYKPVRTVRTRIVKEKKKGLAGLFGGKNTVRIIEKSDNLRELGKELVRSREKYMEQISAHMDSLKRQNKVLDMALYSLVIQMGKDANIILKDKADKMRRAFSSFYWFSVLAAVSAAALLIVLFIMTRRDILMERKTKNKLQDIIRENKELLEMRKNIILTVSHDIRGPLGNIANCAELASGTSSKKKRDGYLDDISRSCAHALRLANRLLDVYKTFEPNELLNEAPFRLDALLDGISDDFKRKANAKALMFECECKGCGVTVKGDADKLEQVIDNILSNAVKFTNSGKVCFRSVYTGGRLAVEISDTGIGMDEETLERVFRPFERAAQDVNSDGFGLGLAITKGLMNALGGSLDVESELGKGSVFRLRLPLTETDEEMVAVDIPTIPPAVLPKRVLVVDDDCILLKVIEEMLGRSGVECTACRNAREAMEALGKEDYDLVLTDVQMPDTDGFRLLKLFRTADMGCSRTVPVAVMTARGDGDSGVYLQAGFCGCLHKPFTMKQLTAFLSSCVSSESHRPKFNFEGLLEHTGDRRHMLEVLLRQSENDKSDMEKALAVLDREALRAVTHRMLSSWSFLGAEGLIESFRKVLVAASVDDETVRNEAATLVYAIERLIGEVKALIENEK